VKGVRWGHRNAVARHKEGERIWGCTGNRRAIFERSLTAKDRHAVVD